MVWYCTKHEKHSIDDTCPDCAKEPTVEELQKRIKELEDGSCRFNCRTAKENWMQGYIEAQHNAARGVNFDAIEAWNDCKEREDGRDGHD